MATVTVLGGDFFKGDALYLFGSLTLRPRRSGGLWGRLVGREYVLSRDAIGISALSLGDKTAMGAALGWGTAGAILAGPAGFVAGAVLGGKKSQVQFLIAFHDGTRVVLASLPETFGDMVGRVPPGPLREPALESVAPRQASSAGAPGRIQPESIHSQVDVPMETPAEPWPEEPIGRRLLKAVVAIVLCSVGIILLFCVGLGGRDVFEPSESGLGWGVALFVGLVGSSLVAAGTRLIRRPRRRQARKPASFVSIVTILTAGALLTAWCSGRNQPLESVPSSVDASEAPARGEALVSKILARYPNLDRSYRVPQVGPAGSTQFLPAADWAARSEAEKADILAFLSTKSRDWELIVGSVSDDGRDISADRRAMSAENWRSSRAATTRRPESR